MALKDYFVKQEVVPIAGTNLDFTVKAVSLMDILVIFNSKQRMDRMKVLFDEAEKAGLTKEPNIAEIGKFMLENGPDVLSEIVASAAGEPDQAHRFLSLPISTQIDALNKVVNLTFEAEGGVKKFGESVVALLAQINQAMAEVNNTQSTGSSQAFIGKSQS